LIDGKRWCGGPKPLLAPPETAATSERDVWRCTETSFLEKGQRKKLGLF
jgi:hypothetical protein